MERESFEDEEVAEILNRHYVAIKVDREERPDIDHIYMTFCQALSGHGGWPLTVIMTPDKKPFFAATYLPKRRKYGYSGLIELLKKVQNLWDKEREELLKSGDEIVNIVKRTALAYEKQKMGKETVTKTFHQLQDFYDSIYGGFGKAPKFPTPHNLSFLLRYWRASGEQKALKMVEKTLESMYQGGIFDHVGFGFSRYSTDQKWLVPHFEKMLYDNALLAIAYTEAYQATKKPLYKEIAEKIFTYVLRDMTSPEGGFYSAEDADSEGEEGKFYVWTVEEIQSVVGKEEAELYCQYYDITDQGNFEGKNIPNLIGTSLEEIEEDENLKEQLKDIREKLFQYREKRVHPHKDDKILTAWNGLMIAALAYSGRVWNQQEYIDTAEKAFDFIWNHLRREDGRLLARYREGEAAYLAYLDDYAFSIWGLIELYETTLIPIYLKRALDLTQDMLDLFWDQEEGGFFINGKDSEKLVIRPKNAYDGALPSGNSVAVMNLLRMARITGDRVLEEKARTVFHVFGGSVEENPDSHTHMIMALLFGETETKEVVIVGEINQKDTREMLKEMNKRFIPFSTVVLNNGEEMLLDLIPFLKGQKGIDNRATAYVCGNYACQQPTNDIRQLIYLIEQ